jgi:hypothetical protein
VKAGLLAIILSMLIVNNNLFAQYLPLHTENKWQYLYSSNTFEGTFRTLEIYEILEDTVVGDYTYYRTSFTDDALIRYSESENKLYIRCGDSDYVNVDFNMTQGNIYQQAFYCLVTRNVSALNGIQNIFNKNLSYGGYEYNGMNGYDQELYIDSIGISYGEFIRYLPEYIQDETQIIEAIIVGPSGDTTLYTYHYKPVFIITPVTEISSWLFSLEFQVNHHYTIVVPDPSPFNNGLNFIKNVKMYSYYAKDDSIINNPPKDAYNSAQPVNINYSITAILDTLLLKSGFSFNYKFVAYDKGIIQEQTSSPDTGYYQCIWNGPLSIKGNENPESQFYLSQNYPNPFNPVTNIRYQIPKSSFVTLKVYDALGNEVEVLVNEEKPAGSYTVSFDGGKLSSGIYFYKLDSGSYKATRKLILLK